MINIFCRSGSKKNILDKLYPLFPEYNIFVDAFVGSGVVSFNNPNLENTKNIINDVDKYLIRLYRLLKKGNFNYNNFIIPNIKKDDTEKINILFERLKNFKNKEEEFELLLLLNCGTFGAKSIKDIEKTKIYRYDVKTKLTEPFLNKYIEKMKHIKIESMDYLKLINKYDSKETFFFLDPPYETSKGIYVDYMIDYEQMADTLKNIKGKFLLTINDSPRIRKIFRDFNIRKIRVKPSGRLVKGLKERNELIIMNYNPLNRGGRKDTPNLSSKYVPDVLSEEDKKKQIRSILQERKRPEVKYRTRRSKWTMKALRFFGEGNTSIEDISRIISLKNKKREREIYKGLSEIMNKGQKAYYTSGSRPNQTPESWGHARVFSVLFGGKSRDIDYKIVDKYNIPLLAE